MSDLMGAVNDPFAVLGLAENANHDEVRARYLELIRLNPPERDAERFNEIHNAYRAASDPMALAKHLLSLPAVPPSWENALQSAAKNPPRLSTELLLSLGNVDLSGESTTESHMP